MGIPDRWLNYTPLGKQIKGTRFIAFKVPLSAEANQRVPNEDTRFEISQLLEKVPNLGMVIDLTFTTKYYRPSAFIDAGIKYVKLMIPGKLVPPPEHVRRFSEYVNSFINDVENEDKLIGVHCTHGVNRTGYLICHHMVTTLKMQPEEALTEFEHARGHKLERENYRNALICLREGNNSDKRENFNAIRFPQNSGVFRDPEVSSRYRQPMSSPRNSGSRAYDRKSRFTSYESNSERRSPAPSRYRVNGRPDIRYRDNTNRYDQYGSDRQPTYRDFSSDGISSNRDPLPSNDFGSRYSVMADLYSERNSPPRERYSWRRPSQL